MSHGLNIYAANGTLDVGIDSIAWNLVELVSIPAGQGWSKTYTALPDYEFLPVILVNSPVAYGSAVVVPVASLAQADGVTTVSTTPGTVDVYLNVLAR